jgi:hypothetical protein
MRKRLVRTLGDFLSLVLPVALALAACNAVLTSRAAADPVTPYSLSGCTQGEMPVPYWLDSRFTPSETEAVRSAFSQWQRDSAARVTFRYMGTIAVQSGSEDDGLNVVVRSTEALPPGRGSTLAITLCRVADDRRETGGGRLYTDADIVLDFSGRVSWSTTGEMRKHDLQSVAAHEVGHLLGLRDVNDPGQLMYWLFEPGGVRRSDLHWGDREGLARAYPSH